MNKKGLPLIHGNILRIHNFTTWIRGLYYAYIVLSWYLFTNRPLPDASKFQRKMHLRFRREYSQNGEDGIVEAIFRKIGTTNKYFVEFGVEDGMECNSRYLALHKGWKGLLMDGAEHPGTDVKSEFITAENIQALFKKYNVPETPDLLSIDIDGNDYWVWQAINHYKPRVVIIEYNSHILPEETKTIPYNPRFHWDGTDYYGASLGVLDLLGQRKGYTLICTDRNGVNAFFVRADLAQGKFAQRTLGEIYHPPAFKGIIGKRHAPDNLNRSWVTVK